MFISLKRKKVNLLLDNFDILINFIRNSVSIVRDIIKVYYMNNIKWTPFVSKSQKIKVRNLFKKENTYILVTQLKIYKIVLFLLVLI